MTAWVMTWLWQGIALAAAVALVLRCAPKLNSATRHIIWSGALVGLACLGWTSWPHAEVTGRAVAHPIYIPSAPDFVISLFLGTWAAVALVNLIRLVPALHAVYALRDRCKPFPQDVASRLSLWPEAQRTGRHADLMVCDAVPGATVLGLQRPCIAIPSTLISALTHDELDQVILHEHAHIRRGDDWARLAEALLLSVLCVHPAAAFIARALNREREMACDEWVVAHTGQGKAYARCLARAADLRRRTGSASTLVPALLGHRHELVRRVERVLAMQGAARRNVSFGGAAMAACAIAMVSMQLHGLRFAEVANILFPTDQVRPVQPAQWAWGGVEQVQRAQHVREVQPAAPVRPTRLTQQVEQLQSVGSVELVQDVSAPVAPALSARTFDAAYVRHESVAPIAAFTADARMSPDVPVAPDSPIARDRWSTFAAPGIEIASVTKKTSIGVANVFSRAGVSLARSF